MKKIINFDMDGTIADLYGVDNWLAKLQASDPSPYIEAKPLLNLSTLARRLNKLLRAGYEVKVISWTAMNATPAYNEAVENAKREWLKAHLPSVNFTAIEIVDYGTPKHEISEGILFDDNEEIRADWGEGAFDVDNILGVLGSL
jgi:5'(3')-deoxyribonucleotidase